jgi:hypothetical protein
MIITQLRGGLGNQMFQYAAARGYQRKKNERIILDTRLLIDLETDIEKIYQRPYSLDIFNELKSEQISLELIRILNESGFQYKLKNKIFRQFSHTIVQDVMKPVDLVQVKRPIVNLVGYFQSQEYFYDIRGSIREDFTFPAIDDANKMVESEILSADNPVSIHIRRGDYLSTSNKNTFPSVTLHYYKNAIAELKRQLGKEYLNAFVFSDDPQWVRENFDDPSLNISFVEGNNAMNSWKDMYLMSCCHHHIIANSSFSWWGAWLSSSDGIALAPRYWFLPNTYVYHINHIIPSTWNIIDYDL